MFMCFNEFSILIGNKELGKLYLAQYVLAMNVVAGFQFVFNLFGK